MERTTLDRVKSMMARHSLSQSAMGRLLGVCQSSVNNWIGGTRAPVQAVARTMDLLELMEAFAPVLFKGELGKVARGK
jgi:predicted transcriptional regulator